LGLRGWGVRRGGGYGPYVDVDMAAVVGLAAAVERNRRFRWFRGWFRGRFRGPAGVDAHAAHAQDVGPFRLGPGLAAGADEVALERRIRAVASMTTTARTSWGAWRCTSGRWAHRRTRTGVRAGGSPRRGDGRRVLQRDVEEPRPGDLDTADAVGPARCGRSSSATRRGVSPEGGRAGGRRCGVITAPTRPGAVTRTRSGTTTLSSPSSTARRTRAARCGRARRGHGTSVWEEGVVGQPVWAGVRDVDVGGSANGGRSAAGAPGSPPSRRYARRPTQPQPPVRPARSASPAPKAPPMETPVAGSRRPRSINCRTSATSSAGSKAWRETRRRRRRARCRPRTECRH